MTENKQTPLDEEIKIVKDTIDFYTGEDNKEMVTELNFELGQLLRTQWKNVHRGEVFTCELCRCKFDVYEADVDLNMNLCCPDCGESFEKLV